jgi:hypothetical protein
MKIVPWIVCGPCSKCIEGCNLSKPMLCVTKLQLDNISKSKWRSIKKHQHYCCNGFKVNLSTSIDLTLAMTSTLVTPHGWSED